MFITPIIPSSDAIPLDNNILLKAEEVIVKSAKLTGGHSPQFIDAIKNLLRITNSYYSNKIESEGTHPIDIEKAMKQEFSSNEKEKDLQQLSLMHIEIQNELEIVAHRDNVNNEKIFSMERIFQIHNDFYSKEKMQYALNIQHGDLAVTMTPGKLRESDVQIGEHVAPKADELVSFLNQFESLYNTCKGLPQTQKLIHALCSHHRLVYIHPFYDGNGRVSRLYLDYLLQRIGLEGYGLWNLSRGLARSVNDYTKALSKADEKYTGGYNDGRGVLSLKGLNYFLEFMLDTALDQLDYMTSVLRIDQIAARIEKYVKFSQEGMFYQMEPLPKHTNLIFRYLLIHGEVTRGDIKDIIGVSKPTAVKIYKELLDREYLYSIEDKGPLMLKFNAHFAAEIMPELFPKA